MIGRIRYWREMERWVPGGPASMDFAFPLVPMGDLLHPRREVVSNSQFADCQPITIHFDGSIDPRDRTEPFKGTMFAAYPGDVVFSKIDVRNGAIGIVPPSFSKVAVTSEYPIHIPDTKQVDPRYLALLLRSPNFLHLLKSAATGTSGRKRVDAENFAELEIPLPDPPEQTALLNTFEKAIREADRLDVEAENAICHGTKEFEASLGLAPPPDLPRRLLQIARFKNLDRWSHEAILHQALVGEEPPETNFEIVSLEDIASVSYGIQKCPSNRPGLHPRPYLRVANVRRGRLDLSEIKYINVPDTEMKRLRLQTNDILFVEGNGSKAELGRAAMWNGEIDDCVHQNHIIKARPDCRRVDPEFLMEWFNTEAGRQHFFRNSKTTSGLGTLNSTDIRTAPVPLPPTVEEQKAIVEQLRAARRAAETIRKDAARIRDGASSDFVNCVFH
jgi:type I restriction enzyme S subunit